MDKLSRRVKLLGGIFAIVIVVGVYMWSQWLPPKGTGQLISIEIPQGASTEQIAKTLQEKSLINNQLLFRSAVLWGGQAASLQAGTYKIPHGSSIPQILEMISQGKITDQAVQFTIPEGYTMDQIANSLAEKRLVNKERFLKEVETGTFDQNFIKQIPTEQGMKYRLEGYLFPDTYQVKSGSTEHEIIDMMLNRFESVVTPQLQEKFQAKGLSLQDAVTMASLVEREARVAKERPIIAGVIFNRLQQNPPMLLQIDATIQYAVGQKPELTYEDLEVDSPYNTYKREGLPPGPIASPGVDCLNAVASPGKHQYLYYVTKKDGTGEHFFGKTLEEHNQNIALSEQNLGK